MSTPPPETPPPAAPTTLIVLAHPDRGSFNGAWARATEAACRARGGQVLWSDLWAMGFDPVEGRAHHGIPETARFDPLKAQERAAAGHLPADVAAEVGKLRAADRVVFHFPMWWFAPPAMLKGWAERVLVHGLLHDVAHRFDTGHLRDTAALFCVTTGGDAIESGPDGKEGNWRMLLWPLAQTLRYCGMDVLEPVAAHGVHGYHRGGAEVALRARLATLLDAQADLLDGFGTHPRIAFNTDGDFDRAGRLKRGASSLTPFIRHTDG